MQAGIRRGQLVEQLPGAEKVQPGAEAGFADHQAGACGQGGEACRQVVAGEKYVARFPEAVVAGEVDVAKLAGEWLALVVPVQLGVAEVGHRCTRETRCGIVATCAKARRIR